MGIPTLISTTTASNAASVSITSGIDSTYDEYMFVLTDIAPATDDQQLYFQVNADGQSGFNEVVSNTWFSTLHKEDDSAATFTYSTGNDNDSDANPITLTAGTGSAADESCAGIVHLFSPSNTTYVTHFYARMNNYSAAVRTMDSFIAGYFDITAAVDEVRFIFSSGNMDGVVQMYGIA
jgi:hypothetical protein